MKIFPNFFIAKYLYSFSFLFTLFLILLRTNNSFINPKNHPTQPSPNHPIFPSYITIYPLQYTLTFSYKSNTKKKKKKRKNHKARPTVLSLPLNSGNAQKIANSFPPPWNGNELDPTAHHWISRSFFSFFFFFGRVETLPGRACIFNSRLSAPLHPLFHRRKKEKKRDVSTRERVRASMVVG